MIGKMTPKNVFVIFLTFNYFCIIMFIFETYGYQINTSSERSMLGYKVGKVDVASNEEKWLDQKLDHFSPSDTRTWRQRYFVNGEFHKKDGPVFLMIGGEGTAQPLWMTEGQWINYARSANALCVMLEHRYYGKSHPTSDMSVDNLQYLSSEQALADLAYFHNFVSTNYNVTGSKWVSFGGSYPGGLSAWFRAKYPHLVHGAVASSAPLKAILDFSEYLHVVSDSLSTSGPQCNIAIQNATNTIQQLLQTEAGRTQLKQTFKLCSSIDPSKKFDIASLFETLTGNFENVVQYNRDNRDFEGAIGTNITIDVLCGMMTDTKLGTPIQRYSTVNKLIMSTYNISCLEIRYQSMVDEMRQTGWNTPAAMGGRQWVYQTCTEFGYYQTSDYAKQPFGNNIPLDYYIQQCMDIYDPKFNQQFIEDSISRTNTMYGDYALRVSRVLFVNGDIDPWHALSFTTNTTQHPAILIHGAAHCADMYPDSPNDSDELKHARELTQQYITTWLSEM